MPEKCKESCPQLEKLENEVRQFREQNSETHKEIFKRLNELELTNAVQNEQYKSIMDKLETMSNKQDALAAQIAAIEAKPGKRWESLIGQIISAIVGVVVGLIFGRNGS